jgi:Putative beta-barrel porin 2
VGVVCARPSGLGVLANGSWSHSSNSALQLTNVDYDTTTAAAGISYSRPSSGSVNLQGTYSRTTYPHRLDSPGQSTGYETDGATLQGERRLGGKIQLGAMVGYTVVMPMSSPGDALAGAMVGAQGKFRGIIYSGDVSFRASSRLQAKLAFNRQISPSLLVGQSYEVQSSYSAAIDYKIGSRITATASAALNESNAQGGVVINPALSVTNSKATILLASLRYQQSSKLSLVLHAQHEQRTADNPRFAYDGYRVGVTAGVNF